MKPGAPKLLSGTALPPAVQVPASDLPPGELPHGVTLETGLDGQRYAVVDLMKVPRDVRRRALRDYRRVGELPKQPKRHKLPNKARCRADQKEETMALEIAAHDWNAGRNGRAIGKQRTGNKLRVVATVTCPCGYVGDIRHHAVLPGSLLDKRFKQKGWQLDPPLCPDCVQQPKEERTMATDTVTPAAGLAQAKVFKLLTTHFDEQKGRYRNGYSDDKIAKETGCALVFVQNCRRECFGDIKEEPAITELRNDIGALEVLIAENMQQLQQEVAGLKAKLAKVSQ